MSKRFPISWRFNTSIYHFKNKDCKSRDYCLLSLKYVGIDGISHFKISQHFVVYNQTGITLGNADELPEKPDVLILNSKQNFFFCSFLVLSSKWLHGYVSISANVLHLIFFFFYWRLCKTLNGLSMKEVRK